MIITATFRAALLGLAFGLPMAASAQPGGAPTQQGATPNADWHRTVDDALGKPGAEQPGVEQRKDQGGKPCGVHQWQRHPFGDHSDVIRMRYQPVGATGDATGTGDDDDAGVPLIVQSGDAPPAQRLRC